ncbi:MAG: PEP-CTERM sorting domain-containing protein [Sphingomonadales bacterium]|nr:PEP-CTERM sorting domain-containing protein [Sphingomonadales bacterium]
MLGANGASASVTTQTALQLAIWELRYEKQSDLFDLRDDQFKVTSSGLSSYINAANALYADSGELAKGTYEFFVATSDGYYKESGKHKKTWVEGKQDLLFYTFTPANAVPEPATWAMMIGGFGLAGAAMRRRKTSVSFA